MPQAYFELRLFLGGVEITWDLCSADLALKSGAAISLLFDLGQWFDLSGKSSRPLSRMRAFRRWSSVSHIGSSDNS